MKKRFSIIAAFALLVIFMVILIIFILLLVDQHPSVSRFLMLGLMGLVVFSGLLFYFRFYVPITRLRSAISRLANGKLPEFQRSNRKDEIGALEDYLAEHVDQLEHLSRLARDLDEGKEPGEIKVRSQEDEIGQAMARFRSSMQRIRKEMAERHIHDEQQNWAARGLARFSQILRGKEDDDRDMAEHFIRELVHYMEVEVGGVFLTTEQDGESMLVLSGAYAFDRNKQVEASYRFGEGLVGRCAIEKERVVITDLPRDYIRIRSGLGEDAPASLVLVPILQDDSVRGVIEVASFDHIPEYKIEFLERLSQNMASILSRN